MTMTMGTSSLMLIRSVGINWTPEAIDVLLPYSVTIDLSFDKKQVDIF